MNSVNSRNSTFWNVVNKLKEVAFSESIYSFGSGTCIGLNQK
ncbi:hypothetical protein P5F73_14980 [Clostridium perfringens]|nr:hypothetical protein [Clostridium perfringens]